MDLCDLHLRLLPTLRFLLFLRLPQQFFVGFEILEGLLFKFLELLLDLLQHHIVLLLMESSLPVLFILFVLAVFLGLDVRLFFLLYVMDELVLLHLRLLVETLLHRLQLLYVLQPFHYVVLWLPPTQRYLGSDVWLSVDN